MSICKHYSDYLVPKATYKPVMTKEVIDELMKQAGTY